MNLMRKAVLPLFILFFSASFSYSQENKWGVSFTPAWVPAVSLHYGLQVGVEYQIKERWRLLTELAIPLAKDKDNGFSNVNFFRIKPEIRYSLTEKEYGVNFYTGLQFSYVFRNWKDINSGCYFEDEFYEDSSITYSSASINSPIYTSSAQIGALINIGGHFCFDLFTGMGVRVINTSYSDVQNTGKVFSLQPKCKIMISPDPAYWVNGNITRFHFNTGLRFLYRF